jgi:uncharacterized membrane protein YhaH (DUF805 family)
MAARASQQLFSFIGRIDRPHFWRGVVVVLACLAAFGLVWYYVFFGTLPIAGTQPRKAARLFWLVFGAVTLVGFVALAAQFVKRLHDRGLTGWWLLPALALPIINDIHTLSGWQIQLVPSGAPRLVLGLMHLAYLGWLLVETGLLRGMKGENQFGPDPQGRASPLEA